MLVYLNIEAFLLIFLLLSLLIISSSIFFYNLCLRHRYRGSIHCKFNLNENEFAYQD